MTEGTTYHFGVNTGSAGTRLDLLLPRLLPDLSRSRGQQLIGAGLVTVNGGQESKHYAVRGGDRLAVTIPPPVPAVPQAEAIPLSILYEDRDLVAVDKPAGMVVHPAPGHPGGTLAKLSVSALMFDYVLTGPISGVSAGQYIVGLANERLKLVHVPVAIPTAAGRSSDADKPDTLTSPLTHRRSQAQGPPNDRGYPPSRARRRCLRPTCASWRRTQRRPGRTAPSNGAPPARSGSDRYTR